MARRRHFPTSPEPDPPELPAHSEAPPTFQPRPLFNPAPLQDGRTLAKSVVEVVVSSKGDEPVHVGFVSKDAETVGHQRRGTLTLQINVRLHEVIDKHRQKPKIFQFNSVDVDGVEIDLP